MSDQNDSRTTIPGTPAVPDLIERYRLRREAWIAQADELARLRDEVRGAAEREAMEIVTAARRDVRQVIMEARRELLVLSAQVQAALGEVSGKPDATMLLNRGASQSLGASAAGLRSIATETTADLFVPESAVKTMLDEARADMESLVEDAKTVPFQATSLAGTLLPTPLIVAPLPASSLKMPFESVPPPPEPVSSLLPAEYFDAPSRFDSPLDQLEDSLDTDDEPEMASVASRVLLSSPYPSDAVAVPSGRSLHAVVAACVVVGAMVIGGSYWWLRGHSDAPPVTDARTPAKNTGAGTAASTASAGKSGSAASPVAAARTPSSSRLTVLVEARQEAWIRTTRDGQADNGRTYAAGEKVQLDANHDISVRAGNAGAVFISVNKGIAMPLGREGQVLTRQFLAEATPPPVAAAPALANATDLSKAGIPLNSRLPAGAPVTPSPLPVPLIQSTVASNPPNAAPLEAGPPATARNEPALPLPRTEAATAPPPLGAPPAASPSTGPQTSSTSAVVTAARQWLEAYHRQERSAMLSLSTGDLQLADERRADERFPATMDVSRTLDKVSVQIAADTAVLTAVMTERGDTGTQRVSPISLVWVLSGGQWRARQVRLVSEARLNQIFR